MTSVPPTTKAAEPYRETERQAAESAALGRMLHASRGCFSLSVAVCNSPALRDHLIGEIRGFFEGVRVAVVPPETVDVFGLVAESIQVPACSALFVVNLEASIRSERQGHPTLRSLNASRELWQKRFVCPVVFWLPEYATALLATQAPDFWRYRSHRFEFVSDAARVEVGMADKLAGNLEIAGSLTAEEKRFRIAELEQRIAEAGEKPPKNLASHLSLWLSELGFLHGFLGELDLAEGAFSKALQNNQELGRLEGMAANYNNLGLIFQTKGNLDRAEQMHLKSLELEEKLGHAEGVASVCGNLGILCARKGDHDRAERMLLKSLDMNESLGNLDDVSKICNSLGVVYREQGRLDEAERMHRRGLRIDERLGRPAGCALHLNSLAVIYRRRGELDRAEDTLREAIRISEQLGQRDGVAAGYGNLGVIHLMRGELDQAESMYKKALEIATQVGRIEVVATSCMNLGDISRERGDFVRAEELWTKARDLFQQIGSAGRLAQLDHWLGELPENGG